MAALHRMGKQKRSEFSLLFNKPLCGAVMPHHTPQCSITQGLNASAAEAASTAAASAAVYILKFSIK